MWKSKQWADIHTTRRVIQVQDLAGTQRKVNGCEKKEKKKENYDLSRKHI